MAIGQLSGILGHYVNDLGNIGAMVGISVKGGAPIIVTEGFRDIERRREWSPDTLYQIGSQTKIFVAIALMLLQRSGKVDLDGLLSDYLDLPIDKRIKVSHLIENSSGLGEFSFAMHGPRFDPAYDWAPRDLVALALPIGQLFPPGERFDYSNTGWVIAAMLIEQASGMSYADFLSSEVIEPLGLTDTFVGASGVWPRERMASGYFRSARFPDPIDTGTAVPMSWAFGTGDIISSAPDMLRFFHFLASGENALEIALSDLLRRTRRSPLNPSFALSLGVEYGLGIERRPLTGRAVIGHPGKTHGYFTGTWHDPDCGVTVTTCVNGAMDLTEPPELAGRRYPADHLFSSALFCAYEIARNG